MNNALILLAGSLKSGTGTGSEGRRRFLGGWDPGGLVGPLGSVARAASISSEVMVEGGRCAVAAARSAAYQGSFFWEAGFVDSGVEVVGF